MKPPHYSRREVLRSSLAAALGSSVIRLPVLADDATHPDSPEGSAAVCTVPDWIAPGKLRWAWALWEPMALYRRGGYGAGVGDGQATGCWVRHWYDRMHSDEILDRLADAGVNLVTTHFYKGFGLKAEAAEMAGAADFTRRAHSRGIRVLGYHQFSTVIYETMLDEVPHLKDWIQRDAGGKLQVYGSATWRWKACPIHDEFIAYLKRVMDRCLIEADMDGVEFDGTSYECHCDKCTAAFRHFLAENNPDPLERFGLPHFRHVRIPPRMTRKDPIWQEWIRFRIDLMGRRLREMRSYVHQKKPGAALVTYVDGPALWRNDRTRLLPDAGDYLDLAIAESHDMPQRLDGELVTKVRHLKEGTAIGTVTLSTDWLRTSKGSIMLPKETLPIELDMAECLACGGHVCTATWALRAGDRRDGSAFFEQPGFHASFKRYMQFSRDHEFLYTDSRPCANAWIYHSKWSVAFDHRRAYNSVLGMGQSLLGRIAYRIAKEPHLEELSTRDFLIVANQTCLSDAECEAIRAAVRRGCHLLITGLSGECDENFRQRTSLPLADLHENPRVRYFEKCPAQTSQSSPMHAAMPSRSIGIVNTVRKMTAEPFAAELEVEDEKEPLSYVDIYRTPQAVVAHIVYYGDGKPENLRLRVAPWLVAGPAKSKPVLYSPYLDKPVEVATSADGWIDLPESFERYAAVRLE